MSRRIQRYILLVNARALGLVTSVICLSILLVDTVEQISTIGSRSDITLVDAVTFSLMKLPALLEQTLPFGLLIAAMMTFRSLSKSAELSVIRASGLSAWTFLSPTILLALIAGLFTMMVISPLGSNLSKSYEQTRAALMQNAGAPMAGSDSGIWLRDGDELNQTAINAQSVDETGTVLNNVRFIREERTLNRGAGNLPIYAFVRRLDARKAKLEKGFWQLEDVIEYTPGVQSKHYEALSFSTDMKRETLIDRFRTPAHIGFWELPAYIETSEALGINTPKFKVRYFSLTALPVMLVAMSLIGALACLRLARLGVTAPYIALSSGSAIALYFIGQLASSLGTTGAIPPLISAWAPPVFAVFICLALVAYREDG